MFLHSTDTSCPSELQQHGFNAADLVLLHYFNVYGEVTLVNVEDDAETALVKLLEETNMTALGNLSTQAVE